jgi:TonB-linked SusC/RagA family outer membrane protein
MEKQKKNNKKGGLYSVVCVLIGVSMLCIPDLLYASEESHMIPGINQQSRRVVSGLVRDTEGIGLPGVNVVEKGVANGTTTDAEGKFSLTVSGVNAALQFTFIGFHPQEITVGSQTTIDIRLAEDSKLIDEIVVIGYGTQRKADVTSAVVSVKADDFTPGKIQDAAELIKGKVAGLSIAKSSGDPNDQSTLLLRGVATLEGSTVPLILIDGVPGDLNTVAPENIESIDVLKDASAAAIYGTRGATGVVLITTKSGKREQRTTVTYSGYLSTSEFYKEAEFMNAEDIRAGRTAFTDLGHDTDWVGAITRAGFTHNHSLTISGGNGSTSYNGDVSYRNEQGIILMTNRENLKMSFDLTHYLFNDIIRLNVGIVKGIHRNNVTDVQEAGFDIGVQNPYRQAVIHNPTAPVYNPDGSYYEDFNVFQYYNPLAILKEKTGEKKEEWTRLKGNLTIEPLKGWKTNLMVATHRSFYDSDYYASGSYNTNARSGYKNSAQKSSYNSRNDYLELTSTYETIAGKHRLSALAGYSYEYHIDESFRMWNRDIPAGDYYGSSGIELGGALKKGLATMNATMSDHTLIGFFGRVSYGFDNKYNVLLSMRREGSSKFGVNYKWGNFPSLSAGWTASNEAFLNEISWLDNLKLRIGYGITGLTPTEPYQAKTRYGFGTEYYYDNGEWLPGLKPLSNPNPNLKWEMSKEFNIGLDISVLDNRLGMSVDVYNKNTSDMLWWYNVPTPPNLYNETLANVGKMRNRGIEVLFNIVPVRKRDFEWRTMLTLSHNQNKLLSLSNDLYESENYYDVAFASDPISEPTHRVEVGQSIGNFWGPRAVGVSDNGLWLFEDPATGESLEFSAELQNDQYRFYLGNGFPKLYAGWNNTFRYKDFDLSLQMTGAFGFLILNEQRMFYENNSIAYNRLKTASDNVFGVRPLSSAQSQVFTSYYLEKGDYLKMTNMTLGYSFKLATKYIQSLRLYLSGENLFCITGYTGLDPELSNKDFFGAGNDPRDKYPTIRSYTLGVNITF